jgi:hypothetical protein
MWAQRLALGILCKPRVRTISPHACNPGLDLTHNPDTITLNRVTLKTPPPSPFFFWLVLVALLCLLCFFCRCKDFNFFFTYSCYLLFNVILALSHSIIIFILRFVLITFFNLVFLFVGMVFS